MRSKFTKGASLLAASLALATAGAGSASAALPELKPTPTESSPVKFKATAGPPSVVIEEKNGGVPCNQTSISGEFINAKEIRNTVVKLMGCDDSTEELGNEGELSSTITSEKLKGHLAYLNKSKKEVGLMLGTEFKREPGKNNEPIWASSVFLCGSFGCEPHVNFRGQLITSITPVNKLGKTLEVTMSGHAGKQGLTKFEGGLENQYLEDEAVGPLSIGNQFEGEGSLHPSFEQGGKAIEVKLEA